MGVTVELRYSITTMTTEKSTRQTSECPVFGHPSKFSQRVLPTYEDIMKAYLFERYQRKTTLKEPLWSELKCVVIDQLVEIWEISSIPTVTKQRIGQMLDSYHSKYRNLLKSYKARKNKPFFLTHINKFRENSKVLFDIAACKCAAQKCTCEKEKKVPQIELKFLNDQRGERQMMISSVDNKTTHALQKRMERRAAEQKRHEGEPEPSTSRTIVLTDSSPSTSATSGEDSDLESTAHSNIDAHLNIDAHSNSEPTKHSSLSSLALICDRTGVSDRTAAAIASSTLKDHGFISLQDKSKVIDRSKIRRARSKMRSKVVREAEDNIEKQPISIFFDGRKDKTLVQVTKGNKFAKEVVEEEHITILQEPNSNFMGHTSPTSGSSENISSALFECFQSIGIDTSELCAVGCDGTVINTGAKNGVITRIEKHLGRPVHWIICQLHGNELPLRHLITKLDGPTTGPSGFTGPIGKQISNCELMAIVKFSKIESEEIVTEEDDNLSTDQKYLLEAFEAVKSGTCPEDLSFRNPGNISHSRWLTTANRLLRLYMATQSPSNTLTLIVQYIMKVYVPIWFTIKRSVTVTEGSKNLFKAIKCTRSMPDEILKIVFPVIQRNGYFGHPENVLLTMICDEKKHIRQLGWRRILKAREADTDEDIRTFQIPPLNFQAEYYYEMINWQTAKTTEPPCTTKFSNDELKNLIQTGDAFESQFNSIPCHTQAVERTIKLVTEASSKVCGQSNRNAYIQCTLQSRKEMSAFDTKHQFN